MLPSAAWAVLTSPAGTADMRPSWVSPAPEPAVLVQRIDPLRGGFLAGRLKYTQRFLSVSGIAAFNGPLQGLELLSESHARLCRLVTAELFSVGEMLGISMASNADRSGQELDYFQRCASLYSRKSLAPRRWVLLKNLPPYETVDHRRLRLYRLEFHPLRFGSITRPHL